MALLGEVLLLNTVSLLLLFHKHYLIHGVRWRWDCIKDGPQVPFLFAMVMDRLTDEVRQESLWTIMFADGIVMCSETREQVAENQER